MSNSNITSATVADEAGDIVEQRFSGFLNEYIDPTLIDNQDSTNQSMINRLNYSEQIRTMLNLNKTTLYVNFEHINDYDNELAEAIQLEYYRFDPYLRKALKSYIEVNSNTLYGHNYHNNANKEEEYFISIYGLHEVERIRAMKSDKIVITAIYKNILLFILTIAPHFVKMPFLRDNFSFFKLL